MDVVLDCVFGEDYNKGYNLLKPMGKYILYGSSNFVTGETKSIFSAARFVSVAFIHYAEKEQKEKNSL